jgi:hypothetical protein
MQKPKRTSAGQYARGAFKPHGSMQLEQSGFLNVLEATGPFNKELVVAADAAQENLYESLAQKGRWGTVLIFRESALVSLEALAEISAILKRRKTQGYAPVAVALVFGPEVEGGALIQSHYLKAYQGAGIDGRIFSNEADAKAWMTDVIERR